LERRAYTQSAPGSAVRRLDEKGTPIVSLLGDRTLVFVIRIWQEPREIDDAPSGWRGSIEALQDGKRRYVTRLEDIPAFLAPYIQAESMPMSDTSSDRPWFDRLRRLTRWPRR